LDDGEAEAVESVALVGSVGFVAEGVAIAEASTNPIFQLDKMPNR
jgi:hypothetical protein